MKPQIKEIRIDELEQYGLSDAYRQLAVVPITPPRIASHLRNPRTEPHDLGLIVALDDQNQLIGFIGLMADFIYFPEKQKVFWISCWWVDKEKGKNLGVPLLFAAYKKSEGKLLADSIPETLPVFAKSKLFHIPEPKRGLRVFLRSSFEKIIARKKPEWKKYSAITSAMDKTATFLSAPFLRGAIATAHYPKEITIEYLGAVDSKIEQFIFALPEQDLFKRGKEELNWILRYPWLTSSESPPSQMYPFSLQTEGFENYLVKLSNASEIIAFLFFTNREEAFKLPYAYFKKEHVKEVSLFVTAFLYRHGAREFTTFHPLLTHSLRPLFPLTLKHTLGYQYVWGKELGDLPLVLFQDGDGDAVFT